MENWQIVLLVAALIILATAKNFFILRWLWSNLEEHWRGVLIVGVTALAVLACVFERLRLGLDLKGGTELLYRINVETVPAQQRTGITATTISVLEKRLSDLMSQLRGTSEMRIQEQGSYRILIQVPGADAAEVARIKNAIQNSGRLEFRMVDSDEDDRRDAREGHRIPGYTPFVMRMPKEGEAAGKEGKEGRVYEQTTFAGLKDYEGEDWFLVSNRIELTGESLARADKTVDKYQAPAVGFEFDAKGKKKFADLTDRNIGRHLAIILDNKLYSAPVIQTRIYGPGIIEGKFTDAAANDLVTVLRGGILPAQLSLELENTVGPTLGWDSIKKGVTAAGVGAILVGIFMIVYYFGTGATADIAVVSNIILILGVMALTRQTLTLPGIAGLVLTMAMAVDANVLINERIREEKERGKVPKLAVKAGYERAFSVIFDSHVTGIITSVILYMVGTGPVQGFAVALGLGLVISLFTALFVTRTMIEFCLNKGLMMQLRMLHFFQRPNIQFMRVRYFCYAVSLTLIAIGMTVFFIRGSKKYDIDFTGGTLLDLELKNPLSTQEVRQRVAEAGYPDAEVQSLWAAAPTSVRSEATDFGIRVPARAMSQERMDEKLERDVKRVLGARGDLESAKVSAPFTLEITLKKGMDQAALREALRNAGYQPADIRDITSPEVKATKYQVWLRAEAEKDPRRAVRSVIKALREFFSTTNVTYNFGKIVEETGKGAEEGLKAGPGLEMSLSAPVNLILIEVELERMEFSGLSVEPRETRGGAEASDVLYVKGPKDALEKLRARGAGTLAVPPVKYQEAGGIEVELKQPLPEGEVKARLEKQADLANALDHIIPIGAAVNRFTVFFTPLSEAKIQEEIRDDIVKVFEKDIASESIPVKVESAAAPEFAPEEPQPPVPMSYFTLKLQKPATLDVIRKKLLKAAAEGTLFRPPSGAEAEKPQPQVTLQIPKTDVDRVIPAVTAAFESSDPFRRIASIGSSVAAEMKNRAYMALALSWVAIILYLWFRFGEAKFGVAAVVALVHDVLISMGAEAVGDAIGNTVVGRLLMIGDIKINLTMVAAFLTIVGYSVADTIVVYDRIRENRGAGSKFLDAALVDASVNQTLSRTVLTSLTVFMVLVALYFLGGPVIHGFAYCMIVGIVTGTYSSVFIASPIIVDWIAWTQKRAVPGGPPRPPQQRPQERKGANRAASSKK
jgi:protein-export membrane protein SecD/preprotein translocase SecF subunit